MCVCYMKCARKRKLTKTKICACSCIMKLADEKLQKPFLKINGKLEVLTFKF